MAKKKSSTKKAAPKKSSGSKGPRASTSVKRAVGKVAKQARDVLGEVLSGAATGAARGAAEVVERKAKAVKATSKRGK